MRIRSAVIIGVVLIPLAATCAAQTAGTGARDLFVTSGKSVIIDSPSIIERVSVADGRIAEAVAATPREIIINGRSAGDTTLIIWQKGGNRLLFDLTVQSNNRFRDERIASIQAELEKELGPDVGVTVKGEDVFLRGTVADMIDAGRAVEIASHLGDGEPINLLSVKVPPVDPQILLKVRFASVDRSASKQLGVNLFSTGALNTIGATTTGQYPAGRPPAVGGDANAEFELTDIMNIFLFRPDLDLGATIKALQASSIAEILAEPNLLTMNGKEASFLAGGEFPFPTLQGGGGGLGAVTIQFREFGIRLNFTPEVTPRNTIRMRVTPEVSALDYANALVFQGFTIPGISARRVTSDIELASGQSFGIAGLLDNRVRETMNKVPGLGDIPLLGKLFQSMEREKNNSELLVIVTPEIVRPIPEEQNVPELEMPIEFLREANMPRTPGMEQTGPVPVTPPNEAIRVEQMGQVLEDEPPPAPAGVSSGLVEFIPAQINPVRPVPVPQPVAPTQATPQPDGGGDD